jgi:hypothetical protein
MPLTKSGSKVMKSMMKEYGKKGEEVFYATMNKKGMKSKWEGKKKMKISIKRGKKIK